MTRPTEPESLPWPVSNRTALADWMRLNITSRLAWDIIKTEVVLMVARAVRALNRALR